MVAFESLAVQRNPNQVKTLSCRSAGVSKDETYLLDVVK